MGAKAGTSASGGARHRARGPGARLVPALGAGEGAQSDDFHLRKLQGQFGDQVILS